METKIIEITIPDREAEARARRRAAEERAQERADRRLEHRIDAWIERLFLVVAFGAIVLALIGILGGCGEAVKATETAARGEEPTIPPAAVVQTPAPVEADPVVNTPEPVTVTAEPVSMVELDVKGPLLETAPEAWAGPGEDPLEDEKIVEALLAQGYLSIAVPMSYEYQDLMRTFCEEYQVPYPLALAVAEVESHFDMAAIGQAGETGMMQLNPGPGGSYHAELEAATGIDPLTPAGNIAGGCYLLGKHLARYGDTATAIMAYRMGQTGADKALAAGSDPMTWAGAYIEAMERWECTVNAWRGW